MFISASYKTDIPTFYVEWFLRRLRRGYCGVTNPFNGRPSRVSLANEDVDGFIFWTKNIAPFRAALREVRERSFPFVVQYTINAYPRELETRVLDWRRSVDLAVGISETYGVRSIVWRYDTIVLSSLTPPDYHRENFERIAEKLAGSLDEVVVSMMFPYKKTLRNIERLGKERGFSLLSTTEQTSRELVSDLAAIAASRGIQLTVCSQPNLVTAGSKEARCVDATRFSDLIGHPIKARLRGNRPTCGCFESRDIGEYDTCPHGCVYCYAVSNEDRAKQQFHDHDPDNDFLVPRADDIRQERPHAQLPLL
jgi:hypothetical protein